MHLTDQDRSDWLTELEKAAQSLDSDQAEFYHTVLHQLILIATPQTIGQLRDAILRAKNVTDL